MELDVNLDSELLLHTVMEDNAYMLTNDGNGVST